MGLRVLYSSAFSINIDILINVRISLSDEYGCYSFLLVNRHRICSLNYKFCDLLDPLSSQGKDLQPHSACHDEANT